MDYLPRDCFQPALQRLDLLLHREILRLRASYQLSMDEFRGLYVSDSQVDALIRQWSDAQHHQDQQGDDSVDGINQLIADYEQESRVVLAGDQRWNHMVEQFQLGPVEQDLLMVALAPELALKYEAFYAYLNNDITRKFPTVDLVMRLAGQDKQTTCRQALSPASVLISEQLLEPVNDNSDRWSLSAGFKLAPSVFSYLLDGVPLDARLLPGSYWIKSQATAPSLLPVTNFLSAIPDNMVTVLEGESGAGRLHAMQQLLASHGRHVLNANLSILANHQDSLSNQLQRLLLQARLGSAGLYLTGLDKLMQGEAGDQRQASVAMARLQQFQQTQGVASTPVYVAVPFKSTWREWLPGIRYTAQIFTDPDLQQRQQLWQAGLAAQRLSVADEDLRAVADRFVLNPGQISAAISALGATLGATSGATLAGNEVDALNNQPVLSEEKLLAAAREQSVGDIGKLASKVCTMHRWQDLILPRTTAERVQEAVAAIIHRGLVYQQWQMCQRTGGASGLMMMFTGSSGTGKTMCASLIAKAVGLDLYCIDLSSVVSKYIGDTEKNLDRIFTAARRANCLLFFDEADALLGKRSEVKDAHDRYANVEVAYLLQKMEQHDGVVIMATNIAKNIDQAFSRRLHYSIEFPRPNAEHREQLWRGMYPPQTPLADDIDFAFLGRNFEGTGGDIKTIALDAAMQAAGNGQQVNMRCLVRAMARQMLKQGKAPSPADFKQYYGLLERNGEVSRLTEKYQARQRVVPHPSANTQ